MKNKAQVSIGGLFLIIVVVIVIVAMMWFLLLPPSCDEESQVELTGILLGFERNSTMWDVQLNNVTYRFNYWDKSYMEKMLGMKKVSQFNRELLVNLTTEMLALDFSKQNHQVEKAFQEFKGHFRSEEFVVLKKHENQSTHR